MWDIVDYFEYSEFSKETHLFCFQPELILLGKFVQAEIWYLDYFEYAEFNAVVFFFCFRSEKLILGKFDTKNQNF